MPELGLSPFLSTGDQEKGEMGLGAVPGRQAAFREGLEQAVLYAKVLGCPRYPSLHTGDLGPCLEVRVWEKSWDGGGRVCVPFMACTPGPSVCICPVSQVPCWDRTLVAGPSYQRDDKRCLSRHPFWKLWQAPRLVWDGRKLITANDP